MTMSVPFPDSPRTRAIRGHRRGQPACERSARVAARIPPAFRAPGAVSRGTVKRSRARDDRSHARIARAPGAMWRRVCRPAGSPLPDAGEPGRPPGPDSAHPDWTAGGTARNNRLRPGSGLLSSWAWGARYPRSTSCLCSGRLWRSRRRCSRAWPTTQRRNCCVPALRRSRPSASTPPTPERKFPRFFDAA
jgi:hypothetical protein